MLSAHRRNGSWEPGWRQDFATLMLALGYADGKDIIYEWRYAEREPARLPALAAELVRLNPDALFAGGSLPTREVAKATATIPIVAIVSDAVREGYTGALGRPGANVTGWSTEAGEVTGKLMESLKAIIPRMTRFAILAPAGNQAFVELNVFLGEAARKVGIEPITTFVRSRDEIDQAFGTMRRRGIPAANVYWPGFFKDQASLARLALGSGVAVVNWEPVSGFARAGGLLSQSPVIDGFERRIAVQLDRILRGTPVREIPFELPTKYLLEINRRTAAALGLTVPPSILLRADEVYE